jgi:hypothetical protein
MNKVKQNFLLFCLFAVIALVGSIFFVARTLSGPPPINPEAKAKNFHMAERGLNLKERLGQDDNATVAFLYGADMQGSLDVCG